MKRFAIIMDEDEEAVIRNGCFIGTDEYGYGTRFETREEALEAIVDTFGEGYLPESCVVERL